MLDPFSREINYLRISVTDRCNLRCVYCMPAEGLSLIKHEDILTFEEIIDFTRMAVKNGITKVRITGGEPLVRRGIEHLVKSLSEIKGIKDLSMTTNGILLDKYAQVLFDAGLHRINISLDSMDPDKYRKITRVGNIEDLFRGIKAAKKVGFDPIKINTVIQKNSKEPDAVGVAEFAKNNGLIIRYIRQMDLCMGQFWIVEGGDGGNCSICNKLRLTSNGKLKPCLFNEKSYDIKELGMENAFQMAIKNKPKCGTLNPTGSFNSIGG
jgi:GTP 3',8-cyclase